MRIETMQFNYKNASIVCTLYQIFVRLLCINDWRGKTYIQKLGANSDVKRSSGRDPRRWKDSIKRNSVRCGEFILFRTRSSGGFL
jgi:hypothetical protein